MLPLSYYRAAAVRAAEGLQNPCFYVFTDDPAWARQELDFGYAFETVSAEDRRDYEELQLMASCRRNIIANSSFSWWGAWLNKHPEKRVFAPKAWFAGANLDTRDLIPEAWEQI